MGLTAIFVYLVLMLSGAPAANASECPAEVYASSCCKSESVFFGVEDKQLQQCACSFYSKDVCGSIDLSAQCFWASNPSVEFACVSKTSAEACNADANCYFYEGFHESRCRPNLCKPKQCNFLNESLCEIRLDCMWQGRLCVRDPGCSCANPNDFSALCGCFKTKKQCKQSFDCVWDNTAGCRSIDLVP